MQIRKVYHVIFLIILIGFLPSVIHGENDLITEIIRDKIEQIRFFEEVKLGDAAIASTKVIPEIYEQQNFRLIWIDSDAILQLIEAVRSISDDGLDSRIISVIRSFSP